MIIYARGGLVELEIPEVKLVREDGRGADVAVGVGS